MESFDNTIFSIVNMVSMGIISEYNCTAQFFYPDTAEYSDSFGADVRDKIRSIRPQKKDGEVG